MPIVSDLGLMLCYSCNKNAEIKHCAPRVALDACRKVIGPQNFEIFDTLGVICLHYISATWELCLVYMICVDISYWLRAAL